MVRFFSFQDFISYFHGASVLANLNNIEFYLAVADIDTTVKHAIFNRHSDNFSSNSSSTKPISSYACRNLLTNLLSHLGIIGSFDDSQLPYRVIQTNKKIWYISFSHSQQQIAVLLADTPSLGVDVEDRPISQAVANRYFCQAENDWLACMYEVDAAIYRQLLWVLKESIIKAQGNSQQATYLITGLATDIRQYLPELLIPKVNQAKSSTLSLMKNLLINHDGCEKIIRNEHIVCGYLVDYKCGFWLKSIYN